MSDGEDGERRSLGRALAGGCLFDLLSGCAFDGCMTLGLPSILIALFLFLR